MSNEQIIIGKRGFDVLKQCFFCEIFDFVENIITEKRTKEFNSFNDYFEYLDGKIYDNSCYYGFVFSKDIISKYNIKVKKLNMDSFTNDNINIDTYENLTAININNFNRLEEKKKDLLKFINAINDNLTYSSFKRKYSKYIDKYKSFPKKLFFNLCIDKYKEKILKIIIQFVLEYEGSCGLQIEDVFFNYGIDEILKALEEIINNYDVTKQKKIKQKINKCVGKHSYIIIDSVYNRSNNLYQINFLYSNNGVDDKSKKIIKKYVLFFEDFIKELNYDLSNCNLIDAPLDKNSLLQYKSNDNTRYPGDKKYKNHFIKKQYKYENLKYSVEQTWILNDNREYKIEKTFDYFCDFVYYLNGDLSNANLLYCDGIENTGQLKNLNFNNAILRSKAAIAHNLNLNLLPKQFLLSKTFNESLENEQRNIDVKKYEVVENDPDHCAYITADDLIYVSYISDLHLEFQLKNMSCLTYEDAYFEVERIIKKIQDGRSYVNLICGDICSDFDLYKLFIGKLDFNIKNMISVNTFITLGNHELWPFVGFKINDIIANYKKIIESKEGFHLLQNNIFYYDLSDKVNELSEEEMLVISDNDLKNKLKEAKLIIFGGIGFSGKNEKFNANDGIYDSVIDRKEDIKQSKIFNSLYKKVSRVLCDKKVLIVTHMPISDWADKDDYVEGFVYVSGHNHYNYFYDDGIKRIYSDNQIGYRGNNIKMKYFNVNFTLNWFANYEDGIYEINRSDYVNFYRGINKYVTFERNYKKLYLIKNSSYHMFIIENKKGTFLLLNGGAVKTLENNDLNYYYDNVREYSRSVEKYLLEYNKYLNFVSEVIKSIGGTGRVHGSIVDIDFYNHLFVNPFDYQITPYYALSIQKKWFYMDTLSLLKDQCNDCYNNYLKLEEKSLININNVLLKVNNKITNQPQFEEDTEMYRISRVIKNLQYITNDKIIRVWNESIVGKASIEKGKKIIKSIIESKQLIN